MTEKKWQPLEFSNEWLDRLLNLRFKIFQESSYTKDRWVWQYQSNPHGKANLALAIDVETQSVLAGQYAVMAYQLKYKNQIISVSQSVDTFTNPDFRNQGIFVDLAKLTYQYAERDGVLGVFGFPNSQSYPGFVKKLGFSDPFSLQFWVKPLTLGVVFKKLKIPKMLTLGLASVPLFFPKYKSNIKQISSLPNDWNQLKNNFEKLFPICTLRTSEYMEWRYLKCPDRKYKIFEYRNDGKLIAVIVTAMIEDEYSTGQIVDLVIADISELDNVIKATISVLYSMGAHTVSTYLHSENIVSKNYSALGFLPRGSEVRFIIKNFGQIADFETTALVASNWYLTGGDTDYF